MTLSDLSIRRPVFAWMLMFGLIVFGAISFTRMGVSEMPDVEFPIIALTARYEGAAPEVMEADVVDPLEDALISIQGIKNITSKSRVGVAEITLEFDLKRDIDAAFQDVQANFAGPADVTHRYGTDFGDENCDLGISDHVDFGDQRKNEFNRSDGLC